MDIERIDFKRLRAFQAVAKYGSMGSAARVLGQTVPAVSIKIKTLERDLNCSLFERLANRVLLTCQGAKFLVEVEDVFQRMKLAVSALSEEHSLSGRLNVAIGSDHGWFFAPLLSRFLRKNPTLNMNLRVHVAADAVKGLMRGDYDAIVGHFGLLPSSLRKVDLVTTGLSLVTQRGDLPSPSAPIELSRFIDSRLITLPRHAETRKLIDKQLSAYRCIHANIIEVANCQTAITFVEEGGGAAIAHSLCVQHCKSERVRARDLGPSFGNITFAIVHRDDDSGSPAVRALVQEMLASAPLS